MLGRVIEIEIVTATGSIIIDDLQITFSISQNTDSKNNKATVTVYNLIDDTVKRINRDDDIIITAGYEDTDKAIAFRGNISEAIHDEPKPDRALVIEAEDGTKFRDRINYKASYSKGIKASTILESVLVKSNIGYNLYEPLKNIKYTDKEFTNGFSFNGTSLELVKKITKILELKYTITNNELKIFNPKVQETEVVLNINKNTSFLIAKRIYIKTEEADVSKAGWEVTTLFQPKAHPRNRIQLTFDKEPFGKEFTIQNVNHVGSIEDGEMKTVMKVV